MNLISNRRFDMLFGHLLGKSLVKSASFASLLPKIEQALEAAKAIKGISNAERVAEVAKVFGLRGENLVSAIARDSDEFLKIYGRLNSQSTLRKAINLAWGATGRTESIQEFAAAAKAGNARQLSLLPAVGETGMARSTSQLVGGSSEEIVSSLIRSQKSYGITTQDIERFHRAYFASGSDKRKIFETFRSAVNADGDFGLALRRFVDSDANSERLMREIFENYKYLSSAASGAESAFAESRQIANGIISAVESGGENAPEARRLIIQLEQQIGTNPIEVSRTLESLSDDQARILGEYYRRTRGYGIPEAIRRSEQRLGIVDVGESAARGADDIKPISVRPTTIEPPTVTRPTTIEPPTEVRPVTGEPPAVVRPGSEGSSIRVPGGLPSAGSALQPITEVDNLATIISKIEQRSGDLTDKEAIIILNMMEQNGEVFAAKLLTEKSGKFRVFLADYDKNVNLRAILLEAEDIIRRSPNAVATIIRDAPAASAAARQRNWSRAARIGAGIAAGLVGAALISFIMGDDEEEEAPSQSAATTSGGGSSGSPQGRGEPTTDLTDRYREASKIMMDKGYLSGIQTSWTKEFDAGFRPFVDAGTKNNKALRGTNLVGGQTWVQAAPTIAFPPTEKGALDAVTILGKFVPAIGEKGTGEAREEVPQVGPGDTRQSSKEDVLADIISRL